MGTVGFSPGEAYHLSLAISNSGKKCVAYADNANKLTVMRFNGNISSWDNLGSNLSAGSVQYVSIAYDNSGKEYVAFSDISCTRRVRQRRGQPLKTQKSGTATFLKGDL